MKFNKERTRLASVRIEVFAIVLQVYARALRDMTRPMGMGKLVRFLIVGTLPYISPSAIHSNRTTNGKKSLQILILNCTYIQLLMKKLDHDVHQDAYFQYDIRYL